MVNQNAAAVDGAQQLKWLLEQGAGGTELQAVLASSVVAVLKLHSPVENTIHADVPVVCSHRYCRNDAGDQSPFPCATVRTLTAAFNA